MYPYADRVRSAGPLGDRRLHPRAAALAVRARRRTRSELVSLRLAAVSRACARRDGEPDAHEPHRRPLGRRRCGRRSRPRRLVPLAALLGHPASPRHAQPLSDRRGRLVRRRRSSSAARSRYLVLWTCSRCWSCAGPSAGVSAAGLIVYAFTMSLAAVDWIALAGAAVVFDRLRPGRRARPDARRHGARDGVRSAWRRCVPPNRAGVFNDLGNLLLMYVLTWAYLAFMQFLIIWVGNLPREIAWYVPRLQTGWVALGVLLVVFHFFAPLAILLFRSAKRSPAAARRPGGRAARLACHRRLLAGRAFGAAAGFSIAWARSAWRSARSARSGGSPGGPPMPERTDISPRGLASARRSSSPASPRASAARRWSPCTSPAPATGASRGEPPKIEGPRLQTAAPQDLARLQAREAASGCRATGGSMRPHVHIPIERAMRILAERTPAMRARSSLLLLLFARLRASADDISFDPHPGARVPGARLPRSAPRRYLGRAPVVLVLGYFGCVNLCGTTLTGVSEALSDTRLVARARLPAHSSSSIDQRDEKAPPEPRPGWHFADRRGRPPRASPRRSASATAMRRHRRAVRPSGGLRGADAARRGVALLPRRALRRR